MIIPPCIRKTRELRESLEISRYLSRTFALHVHFYDCYKYSDFAYRNSECSLTESTFRRLILIIEFGMYKRTSERVCKILAINVHFAV